jgi:hypothetical protein
MGGNSQRDHAKGVAMKLHSRKFKHDPEGTRIYSGKEAKRRAAGVSPGWIEVQTRWIRAKTDGDSVVIALVVAGILALLIAVCSWVALG